MSIDFSILPPFPTVVDNTMLTTFRACPRKFFYEHLHGLKLNFPSIHLHAGAVYAKALETYRISFYRDNKSPDQCLADALTAALITWGEEEPFWHEAKNLGNILCAVAEYFKEFNVHFDYIKPYMIHGEPAVEFSFAIPILDSKLYTPTGQDILYCGRFDMLAECGGALFVYDDKTTGSIGSHWADQWTLRSQFTGYVWAAKSFGYPVAGALVRGIAIQKTQFKFATATPMRANWQIDQWYLQVQNDLEQIAYCYAKKYWPVNLDAACEAFGGCPYRALCTQQDPEKWLEPNYIVNKWDPLQANHYDPKKEEFFKLIGEK